MEDVGFTDVDIAWRQEAFFVAGGRRAEQSSMTWDIKLAAIENMQISSPPSADREQKLLWLEISFCQANPPEFP